MTAEKWLYELTKRAKELNTMQFDCQERGFYAFAILDTDIDMNNNLVSKVSIPIRGIEKLAQELKVDMRIDDDYMKGYRRKAFEYNGVILYELEKN